MNMDDILKEFLNAKFEAISDKLDSTVSPIIKDIENHRGDIDDLYDKDRDTKQRLTVVEVKIEDHFKISNERKDNKRFSFEMWIVVGVFLADKIFQYLK